MPYKIDIAPSAQRALRKMPPAVRVLLDKTIRRLREEPRPHDASKMVGEADTYRVRAGDYRILYEIQDQVLLILVLRLGHRRDIYRKH